MMNKVKVTKLHLSAFLKKKLLWDLVFLLVFILNFQVLLNLQQEKRAKQKLPEKLQTLTYSKIGEFNEATLRSIAPNLTPKKVKALFATLPDKDIKLARVNLKQGVLDSISLENHSLDLFNFKSISSTDWELKKEKIQILKSPKPFQGVVDESLWTSAEAAGVPQDLIVSLSEIFSWQIDFTHDLKTGSKWRFLVEEKVVNKRHFAWGNIVAAEIEMGDERYQAFLHVAKNGQRNYFDANGERLKRTFLRSPIKYASITSKFKLKRFHPMLKRYRPHFGVDYAAKKGTPVRVVGDGTVVSMGNYGSAGRMLKIQHSKKYTTAYMHLSKFPKGVVMGSKVTQGQIIGWVGNSGLSTGPHLHFEFYRNGRYFNPLSQRLYPKLGGVPKKDRKRYLAVVRKKLNTLPEWEGG